MQSHKPVQRASQVLLRLWERLRQQDTRKAQQASPTAAPNTDTSSSSRQPEQTSPISKACANCGADPRDMTSTSLCSQCSGNRPSSTRKYILTDQQTMQRYSDIRKGGPVPIQPEPNHRHLPIHQRGNHRLLAQRAEIHSTADAERHVHQDDAATVTQRNFAGGALTANQQLLCDFFCDMTVARPLPMYSVPGMIDHF